MAFDSSTVSVGDFTKKSDYDRLLANTQFNKANITVIQSSTATFVGEKTFQSSTIFNSPLIFNSGAWPFMAVEDRKATSTDGGTFTASIWKQRDLNTIQTNSIVGASLSSDYMVLPSGTYVAEWSCPAYNVNFHQSRLYDLTGGSVLILGTSEVAGAGDTTQTRSLGKGRFTITAQSTISLQHKCNTGKGADGLGAAAATGMNVSSLFSVCSIWKER